MTRRSAHVISILILLSAAASRIALNVEEIPPELKHLFLADLDTWEPRKEFSNKLPYYQSGFDEDGRPVWVVEFGKWDVGEFLQRGGAEEQEVYKYIDQLIYRIINSFNNSTAHDDVDENVRFTIIFDMDGFAMNRLRSVRGITLLLRTMRLIVGVTKYSNTYIINANYAAQAMLNIIRPILGNDFARVEIYGNNPAIWRPVLRRAIPADQLPDWYGGIVDFKPLKVYG